MSRIVVDLYPVLPGGENGGAKIFVIELLRKLAEIAPQHDFILLTSTTNHDYFAFLDAANVTRYQPRKPRLLKHIKADLFFCPFTTVSFFEHDIPVVSVVYDLQCYYYPHFFSREDEIYRKKSFIEASQLASRLVCISDYVRQTVLENAKISSQQVVTSYIRLSRRLNSNSLDENFLASCGLHADEFLLYPANFWAHKNHIMLVKAYNTYLTNHPDSKIKLVFTGAPDKNMDYLQSVVTNLGLLDKISFLGFLTNDQFANLMQACRALVFPSLYEGFGMPVVEAMAFGKPVLCSNVTSLPEVTDEAAILFDPHKPEEIVAAIEQIEKKNDVASALVERGYKRFEYFSDTNKMAEEYLNIFEDAINHHQNKYVRKLEGIYEDGWVTDQAVITYEPGSSQRRLEFELTLPEWSLLQEINVNINDRSKVMIKSNQTITISSILNDLGGTIELTIEPTFQLNADDGRQVSCFFQNCRIISQNKDPEPFLPVNFIASHAFSIITTSDESHIPFMKDTVESVLSQEGLRLECIIISERDEIPEAIKNYDSRFKWILEPQYNHYKAINKGINSTYGDIIGWLNAGDSYHPDALKIVRDFFISHPEIEIVYGQASYVDGQDPIIKLDTVEPWSFDQSFYESYLSQSAIFVRRSVIEKAGLFDEKLQTCADYEYWLRLAASGMRFAYIPQVFVNLRALPRKQIVSSTVYKKINNMMLHSFGRVSRACISYYAHAVINKYVNEKNYFVHRSGYILVYLYSKLRWNNFLNKTILKKMMERFSSKINGKRADC